MSGGRTARRWSVEVATDDGPVTVQVARMPPHRAPSFASHASRAGSVAHPDAWPTRSADRAAQQRTRDRHPTVAVLEAVAGAADAPDPLAAVDAAAGALAQLGLRRIDVPLRHDPARAALPHRWVHGRAGPVDLASRVLRYPWSPTDVEAEASADRVAPDRSPSALDRRLPPRVARWRRRLAIMDPAQAPELARTAAGEARAALRHRYAPGGARPSPVAGAPAGTYPFAVTRHRTLDLIFELVPPGLRRSTFLDVGCGDGRVLRAARDAGFDRLLGWELDPDLAALAARRLGTADGTAVRAADALVEPVPEDVGLVFLNNPFDADRTARFAAGLGASLRAAPRPLLLVYVNPRPIEPLEAAGLVLVHANPACSVLASVAEP